MKPTHVRGVLVVAVFALLAALSAAGSYLFENTPAPSPAPAKPLGHLFWGSFRYYLSWAIVTPAVLWLSRRVPLVTRRWWRPVAFHLCVPVLASGPFFAFRLLFTSVFTPVSSPLHVILGQWWQIIAKEIIGSVPIYWLLLGVGSVTQVFRDDQARRVRAVELRRSLAAAQLDAMRMKLQPHFLFNTLNAVGALAQTGDTDGVTQMVEHLGTLLRLSMETGGRQFVTLDEELRLLNAYLAIEEVRFKDRLTIVRRIDQAVTTALVPNLILQPIVEHVLVHGLSRRMDATTVEIAAQRIGPYLIITIGDGTPGTSVEVAPGAVPDQSLDSVHERLAAIYGHASRLQVDHGTAGGMAAHLRLLFEVAPDSQTGR